MIIYNVTVKIDHAVHDEWFNWMKKIHIPEVMSTGYFLNNQIFKILVDDEDGISYSIQYSCANMQDLLDYQKFHATDLQKKHQDKFGNQYVAFRTVLEKVSID